MVGSLKTPGRGYMWAHDINFRTETGNMRNQRGGKGQMALQCLIPHPPRHPPLQCADPPCYSSTPYPGAILTIALTQPSTAPSHVHASAPRLSVPLATPAPRTVVTRVGPVRWWSLTWHCHAGTWWPGCPVIRRKTWQNTSAGELCHRCML